MGWLRRTRSTEAAEEIDGARQMAAEDVTVLGEQLQRLDEELAGGAEAALAHHQRALDGYQQATRDLDRLENADQVQALVQLLDDARYQLACARAAAAGLDPPEQRRSCTFNPQHGPSVRDLVYTFPRTGTRQVAACRQCLARIEADETPELRRVQLDGRTVPYWDAGQAYLPYLGRDLIPPPGAGTAHQGGVFLLPSSEPVSGSGVNTGGFGEFNNPNPL